MENKIEKATPRPWSIKENHEVVVNMEITGYELIASCGSKWLTRKGRTDEAIANAELIVRAVNSYDALIEACKGLVDLMTDKTVGKVNPDDHGSGLAVTTYQFNHQVTKKALEAIKNAEK